MSLFSPNKHENVLQQLRKQNIFSDSVNQLLEVEAAYQ